MIHLTASARKEILRMRDRQLIPDLKVRINIQSGGCLGSYYYLSLTHEVQADDQICGDADLSILIESSTEPYVQGLVIDYSEDLMGGGFRFQNPNATQTCSCSNSFSILPIEPEVSFPSKAIDARD